MENFIISAVNISIKSDHLLNILYLSHGQKTPRAVQELT